MKINKDPENIGWAGCIHIDRTTKKILAVKSTKRQAQIDAEIKKRNWHPSKKATWMITGELSRAGTLQKADKLGPAGGKIAYWANEKLQSEFQDFCGADNDLTRGNTPTQEEMAQFQEYAWKKVLFDDALLLQAADATAESEFVEEIGLIVKEKILLFKIEDEDRQSPRETFPEMFYPRFWYLVKSVKSGGTMRTEPIKNTISEPRWVPLMKLHPFKSHIWKRAEEDVEENDEDILYPFHPVHAQYGVVKAVQHLIDEGDNSFVEVLEYLESAFGKTWTTKNSRKESWEDIVKSVQKI
ncbi:MAG: hypothetical protein Q8P07_05355 [bacterium]|nr:hypothetical protein [bacterium]